MPGRSVFRHARTSDDGTARPRVAGRRGARRGRTALAAAFGLVAASVGLWACADSSAPVWQAGGVPTPDHVVVAVFENHSYLQIIGSPDVPYITSLRTGGADLTQFYAETHPSQPNYFVLFSGATQGVTGDSCYSPGFSSAPNLASELLAAGKTWASYSESLPSQGSTVCTSGRYARKHDPWFGFRNVPTSTAKTFAQFPADFTDLPTVSFVVPNVCDDMHDCPVSKGDTWLRDKLGAYATWARTHNSLLIVTFDEDDYLSANRIPTVLYGQPVSPGSRSSTSYNHESLLRTLEDMYGLPHTGNAGSATDITGVWGP